MFAFILGIIATNFFSFFSNRKPKKSNVLFAWYKEFWFRSTTWHRNGTISSWILLSRWWYWWISPEQGQQGEQEILFRQRPWSVSGAKGVCMLVWWVVKSESHFSLADNWSLLNQFLTKYTVMERKTSEGLSWMRASLFRWKWNTVNGTLKDRPLSTWVLKMNWVRVVCFFFRF